MTDLEFYINNMKEVEKAYKNNNVEEPMFLTSVQFSIKSAEEVNKKLKESKNND